MRPHLKKAPTTVRPFIPHLRRALTNIHKSRVSFSTTIKGLLRSGQSKELLNNQIPWGPLSVRNTRTQSNRGITSLQHQKATFLNSSIRPRRSRLDRPCFSRKTLPLITGAVGIKEQEEAGSREVPKALRDVITITLTSTLQIKYQIINMRCEMDSTLHDQIKRINTITSPSL